MNVINRYKNKNTDQYGNKFGGHFTNGQQLIYKKVDN